METDSLTLPGIGKLVLVKRKAGMGRNPAKSKSVKIPTKTAVRMRMAKAAKDAIVTSKKKEKERGLHAASKIMLAFRKSTNPDSISQTPVISGLREIRNGIEQARI